MNKKVVKRGTDRSYRDSTYYFHFAPPVRPGSAEAFSLPSLVMGKQVPPVSRPAPHPDAVLV
jgi:hypothetical protein